LISGNLLHFMNTLEINTYYHIYNHANGNENLFRERENYRFFLEQYQKHITPVADTLAYCLMPNHFHLLVRIKEAETLLSTFPKLLKTTSNLPGFQNLEGLLSAFISKQFSNLFNSYTKAFNKKYQRKGSLFIKNFKRKAISNDQYFGHIITYIHLNPIKHGFVTNIADWNWTSYHDYLHQQPSFIHRQPVLDWFGTTDEFRNFHETATREMTYKTAVISVPEHD